MAKSSEAQNIKKEEQESFYMRHRKKILFAGAVVLLGLAIGAIVIVGPYLAGGAVVAVLVAKVGLPAAIAVGAAVGAVASVVVSSIVLGIKKAYKSISLRWGIKNTMLNKLRLSINKKTEDASPERKEKVETFSALEELISRRNYKNHIGTLYVNVELSEATFRDNLIKVLDIYKVNTLILGKKAIPSAQSLRELLVRNNVYVTTYQVGDKENDDKDEKDFLTRNRTFIAFSEQVKQMEVVMKEDVKKHVTDCTYLIVAIQQFADKYKQITFIQTKTQLLLNKLKGLIPLSWVVTYLPNGSPKNTVTESRPTSPVVSSNSLTAREQRWYPVLGLALNKKASDEDIRKAYRKLALKWHPDKNFSPEAPEQFRLLKEAYVRLTDASISDDTVLTEKDLDSRVTRLEDSYAEIEKSVVAHNEVLDTTAEKIAKQEIEQQELRRQIDQEKVAIAKTEQRVTGLEQLLQAAIEAQCFNSGSTNAPPPVSILESVGDAGVTDVPSVSPTYAPSPDGTAESPFP